MSINDSEEPLISLWDLAQNYGTNDMSCIYRTVRQYLRNRGVLPEECKNIGDNGELSPETKIPIRFAGVIAGGLAQPYVNKGKVPHRNIIDAKKMKP